MTANKWAVRIVGLIVALGVTLGSFLAWGTFGSALSNAMRIVYSEPKKQDDGVFSVKVLPAPGTNCTKDHPCPTP